MGQQQAEALGTRLARHHPYYEKYDRGSDWILRCKDCGRLITHDQLFGDGRDGITPCCGTRSVREVRAMSLWEWLKLRLGIIDFPHRAEFLTEFGFPLFGFKVRPPSPETPSDQRMIGGDRDRPR
jgi:hypothetical protein